MNSASSTFSPSAARNTSRMSATSSTLRRARKYKTKYEPTKNNKRGGVGQQPIAVPQAREQVVGKIRRSGAPVGIAVAIPAPPPPPPPLPPLCLPCLPCAQLVAATHQQRRSAVVRPLRPKAVRIGGARPVATAATATVASPRPSRSCCGHGGGGGGA